MLLWLLMCVLIVLVFQVGKKIARYWTLDKLNKRMVALQVMYAKGEITIDEFRNLLEGVFNEIKSLGIS